MRRTFWPVQIALLQSRNSFFSRWASRQTDGRIPGFLDSLSPDTRLILANAVMFKGAWEVEFQKSLTKPGPFAGLDGSLTEAPLMHTTDTFDCAQTEGCRALRMPFKEGPFALIVLLPERSQFQAFEKALNSERLERIDAELSKSHGRFRVQVTVPRFHFENDHDLIPPLRAAGLRAPFGPGADFNRLTSKASLQVGAVRQKAMVNLDEKGAEAASVTSSGIDLGEPTPEELPPLIEFRADHPFLFLIRDITSGTVLFLGRCVKPEA